MSVCFCVACECVLVDVGDFSPLRLYLLRCRRGLGSASVVMTVDGFTGGSYNEVKETSLLRSPNDNAAPNSSLTLDEPEPRRLFCIKNWSPAAFKPFAVPYKILTAPTLPMLMFHEPDKNILMDGNYRQGRRSRHQRTRQRQCHLPLMPLRNGHRLLNVQRPTRVLSEVMIVSGCHPISRPIQHVDCAYLTA
ncbi:MAG: hypothetical protein Ct9H90mP5_00030 [Acidimicrobiaceae bacterium]|nr:MAG: hypothetical protein Ct9H90mP5_00030 [Acidimicrobiaceae bacterium]